MKVRELLQDFQFGNPVAEYDRDLGDYFLVTDVVKNVISGRCDMVAGDKGTGKTAIYKYLKDQYENIPELNRVEIVAGFNQTGEPLFRRLGNEEKMTEGQYITFWKMYFLSLAGNWLLKRYRGKNTPAQRKLEALLSRVGLLSLDDSAGTIFSRLIEWVRLNAVPKTVGVEFSFNELGIPVVTPKVELGGSNARNSKSDEYISHVEAFEILNAALKEKNTIIWIIMDRLDEAFVGRPDIETPALRALIRTFMDLDYKNLKIKIFVRNDLFRKITREGFVNLTHVGARRKQIIWNDDDLFAMLTHRIGNNKEILRRIGVNPSRVNDRQLFNVVFSHKYNNQRITTWRWMLNNIRDGNWVKSPRNIIDLCVMAQEEQLLRERRSPRNYGDNVPLIESASLKKAVARLSEQRIEDTLMAEYGEDVKTAIKAFQNEKAEQNEETLSKLFGVEITVVRLIATILCEVGFLEQTGSVYKVPPLYRPGLNITQGKAFTIT